MKHLKEIDCISSEGMFENCYYTVNLIEHDMQGNQTIVKSMWTIPEMQYKAIKKLYLRHNRTVLKDKAMRKALELIEVSDFYKDWKKIYKRNLFKNKCYYTAFNFNERIKEYYYNGDLANDIEKSFENNDINEAISTISKGGDVYEKLRIKIEFLIGEGNYIYDYYSFGNKVFSLYWFISKDNYEKTIDLIKSWLAYEEIDHLVKISSVEYNNRKIK